jgi:hypothetical protein
MWATFVSSIISSLKKPFVLILRTIYMGVEALEAAADTGSSLLAMQSNNNNNLFNNNSTSNNSTSDVFTSEQLAIACSGAVATGLVSAITIFFFQGSILQERLLNNAEKEEEEQERPAISARTKYAYFAMRYLYMGSGLVIDFFRIVLLYSALNAWISDIRNEEETPLSFVSSPELFSLLLYYLLLDVPFMATNEMAETLKEMRKIFRINTKEVPDRIMNCLLSVFKHCARSPLFQKYVRIFGSLADTAEHITPLILFIPPEWVSQIANAPPSVAWSVGVSASLPLALITTTIYLQTVLFEGNISEANLKKLANLFEGEMSENNLKSITNESSNESEDGSDSEIDNEARWLNPRIAKVLYTLLYLGGLTHGFDTAISFFLILKELGVLNEATWTVTLGAFLTAWAGSHFSEVRESQESLEKITRIEIENPIPQSTNRHSWWSGSRKNYGTYKEGFQTRHAYLIDPSDERKEFTVKRLTYTLTEDDISRLTPG